MNQGSFPKPLASQTFGVNQSAKLVPLCSEHRELLDGYIMEDTGEEYKGVWHLNEESGAIMTGTEDEDDSGGFGLPSLSFAGTLWMIVGVAILLQRKNSDED